MVHALGRRNECKIYLIENAPMEQRFVGLKIFSLLTLTSLKRRKSPCIDICEFSGPNGWCLGCGRTRHECQRWKKMKPYEANILEKELKKRMSQLGSEKFK